jgi:hypothetical protein
MSDGPNGVRGVSCESAPRSAAGHDASSLPSDLALSLPNKPVFNGTPSTCFPCSTGLGSAFDVELAKEIGEALADECRHKGAHCLLAPTVNTQRSPLGGRGFESFSEVCVALGGLHSQAPGLIVAFTLVSRTRT